jgi:hypothetical protein
VIVIRLRVAGSQTNVGQEADAGTAPPPARDPPAAAAMHARDGAPGACPSLLYSGDVRSVEVYATTVTTHTHRHTDTHTQLTLSPHTPHQPAALWACVVASLAGGSLQALGLDARSGSVEASKVTFISFSSCPSGCPPSFASPGARLCVHCVVADLSFSFCFFCFLFVTCCCPCTLAFCPFHPHWTAL